MTPLGLSAEELRRKGEAAASPLPVREPLLADRPEHRIPWEAGRQPLPADDGRHFRMQPPDCRLDLGEGHIDPDLFELFLHSGVYLEYAKRHLRPEQIDAVALDDYLP